MNYLATFDFDNHSLYVVNSTDDSEDHQVGDITADVTGSGYCPALSCDDCYFDSRKINGICVPTIGAFIREKLLSTHPELFL